MVHIPLTMTLQDAIADGYTHVSLNSPDSGYQSLTNINDVTQEDIDTGTVYLADKESFCPSGVDNETLKDMIADHIAFNHSDNTGDDTDAVYDAIMAMDFSDVVNRIDTELAKLNSYRWMTNIRLV